MTRIDEKVRHDHCPWAEAGATLLKVPELQAGRLNHRPVMSYANVRSRYTNGSSSSEQVENVTKPGSASTSRTTPFAQAGKVRWLSLRSGRFGGGNSRPGDQRAAVGDELDPGAGCPGHPVQRPGRLQGGRRPRAVLPVANREDRR